MIKITLLTLGKLKEREKQAKKKERKQKLDNALYDIYTRQINLKAGVRDIKMLNAKKSFMNNLEDNINDLSQKQFTSQFFFWNQFNYLQNFLYVSAMIFIPSLTSSSGRE